MELDHPSREKAAAVDHHQDVHVTWNMTTTTSSDDHQDSCARSYKCSFCQRGFSNAQALGGHMNIHRKDRARLKEFSTPKLSLTTSTNTTLSLHPTINQEYNYYSSSDDTATTGDDNNNNNNNNDGRKEDLLLLGDKQQELLQLSLSINDHSSSSSGNELKLDQNNNNNIKKYVKKINMQSNDVVVVDPRTGLDLELRLGQN